MSPTLHIVLAAAAVFGLIACFYAMLLGQWKYTYWSLRERELRDKLRDQGLSGHDTVTRA